MNDGTPDGESGTRTRVIWLPAIVSASQTAPPGGTGVSNTMATVSPSAAIAADAGQLPGATIAGGAPRPRRGTAAVTMPVPPSDAPKYATWTILRVVSTATPAGGRLHAAASSSSLPTPTDESQVSPPFGDRASRSRVSSPTALRHTATSVSARPRAETNEPEQARESSGQRTGFHAGCIAGTAPSTSTIVAPGAIAPATRRSDSQVIGPGGGSGREQAAARLQAHAATSHAGTDFVARACRRIGIGEKSSKCAAFRFAVGYARADG